MGNEKSLARVVGWSSLAVLAILISFVGMARADEATAASDALEQGFRAPPDSVRPWVYWFWLAGNVTRQGITADLEAMKRVGIGGVLIMEVDKGTPPGPATYLGRWRNCLSLRLPNSAGWGCKST